MRQNLNLTRTFVASPHIGDRPHGSPHESRAPRVHLITKAGSHVTQPAGRSAPGRVGGRDRLSGNCQLPQNGPSLSQLPPLWEARISLVRGLAASEEQRLLNRRGVTPWGNHDRFSYFGIARRALCRAAATCCSCRGRTILCTDTPEAGFCTIPLASLGKSRPLDVQHRGCGRPLDRLVQP